MAMRNVPTPASSSYHAVDRFQTETLEMAESSNKRWKMWCDDEGVDRSKPPSVDVVCQFMKSCVYRRFRDETKMQKEIGIQRGSMNNIKYASGHS